MIQDKIKGLFGVYLKAMSLHRKILLSMVILLLVLGLAMVLITGTVLSRMLRTEFQHKGLSCAKSLSANSFVDVLTQNKSRLQRLIDNEKKLDKDIAYIFIVDSSGRLLAHTFARGFPVDLMRVNTMQKNTTVRIQPLDTQLGLIYDIAALVFSEKSVVGQVRVGIKQNSIQQTILTLNFIFTITTLFIVLIGILLADKLSSFITRPISKLVEATQAIQRGDFSTQIIINTKDEIALLATSFNEMASRLNQVLEEKKRLKVAEERNRIAFDLHDGCAQNMASIIKRIELCDKLFKIDPNKAIEELNFLKEYTREILNTTRRVIFDLTVPQGAGSNFSAELNDFVRDYQVQHGINVKLDLPASINDILGDRANAVFYIVTEAFNNIYKHSQARNIRLQLKQNFDNLSIDISDDGKGFDVDSELANVDKNKKLGLISMRQRAVSLGGSLIINSKPDKGTEVSIKIPIREK